jgi:adenylate kinase family enzyme
MIIGQPGSGKSTLAIAIAKRTGLPAIHIDKMHWQPGWVERGRADKDQLSLEAAASERWVFEGGHSATWAERLARADMLVWLDRPVALRLWRVILRAVRGRGQIRPDMADGCPERLRMLPEFMTYIWSTRHSARAKMVRLAQMAPPHCKVVRLRSDAEMAEFLASFQARTLARLAPS